MFKQLVHRCWRIFHPQTAVARDFIETVIETRRETLNTIDENSKLTDENKMIKNEAMKYLDIADKLMGRGNYQQAYNVTLIAERRILILLLRNEGEFPNSIDVKRMDYLTDAKGLERDGQVKDEELKILNKIREKSTLSESDWMFLSHFIPAARVRMVSSTLQQAIASDRVLKGLILFSMLTSSLLLFLHILTLGGLITLFPDEAIIQIPATDTATQSLFDLPFITQTSFSHFITLTSTMIFGVLGALVFGILTQRRTLTTGSDLEKSPATVLNWWFDVSRLVLGAISAPIVVMFAYSGIFQINEILTATGIFAISFMSGYSEVLLDKTLKDSIPISGETPEEKKSEEKK